LEDKEISGINQMLILEHYLGNKPCQMHWHFKIIFYKCSMKLVNKLETKLVNLWIQQWWSCTIKCNFTFWYGIKLVKCDLLLLQELNWFLESPLL
jgi:hypothetical protein